MFDDDAAFRKGILLFFEDSEEINIVATFPDAKNVLKAYAEHSPDVVLMDYQMPGTNGVNALEQLIKVYPDIKLVMLTTFMDNDVIFGAICAGASGYVVKGNNQPKEVEDAIKDVAAGGGHMSPSIAIRAMRMMNAKEVTEQKDYVSFTPREKEVLQKMVDGNNRIMVADRLNLSIHTVNDYIDAIYKKLHVNSAQEAVREAIKRNII